MSCPSVRKADAETKGLPKTTAVSEIRYRVAGLSVQSKTKSYPLKISGASWGARCARCAIYFECGFNLHPAIIASASSCRSNSFRYGTHSCKYSIALSTLYFPTFLVRCSTCRCRFEDSTVSPSTRPIVPTPAPARYNAAGHPNPPAPTIRTLAFRSSSCPASEKNY